MDEGDFFGFQSAIGGPRIRQGVSWLQDFH